MVNQNDNVNHPGHYEGKTSIECIESMIIALGVEYVQVFCIGNSYKYLWRYKNKNGEEDLNKAQWYLDKYYSLVLEYDSDPLDDKAMLISKIIKEKKDKINE